MMLQLAVLTLAAGVVTARPALRAQAGPPPPAAAASARSFPADSVVLDIIKQRVADKRSAGIVVGMLDADGRTRIVAFGDPGPGQPPLDGNSVFEIGSISKVFTATVLAELVKEGRVRLEDPIDKYLPASVHVPERNGLKITLGNLSEQNSRLAEDAQQLQAEGSEESVRGLRRPAALRLRLSLLADARPGRAIRVLQPRRRPAWARADARHGAIVRGNGARACVEAARHDEHGGRAHAVDEGPPRAGSRRAGIRDAELGPRCAGRSGRDPVDDDRHAQVRGGERAPRAGAIETSDGIRADRSGRRPVPRN